MALPSIVGEEWKRLWISIFILVLISSAPYLVGWSIQDSDHIFSGAVIDRTDYSVYLSAIHDGMQGNLSYRFKFTTEPQPAGVYLRLFYQFLGAVGGVVRLNPQTIFHSARIFFGTACLIALYLLSAASFATPNQRYFAFMLMSVGAGLGWLKIFLLPPGAQMPVDFWMPEAFTLFSIFAFPHFSAVTACIALIVVLFDRFIKKNSIVLFAGVLLLSLFAQQINPISPFMIEIVAAALCLCSWVSANRIIREQFIALSFLTLSFAPQFIYQQFILKHYPLWAGFSAQNITPSPSPAEYLWGFGFLLILALPAIFLILKTRQNGVVYASAVWVIGVFIAAYLPVSFQRRFLHGVTLPLGLLVAYLIFNYETLMSRVHTSTISVALKRNGSLALIFLFSLSTLFLFSELTSFTIRRPDSIYDPKAVVHAVDWLGSHAKPVDAVLCFERTSQVIAERTGLTVYVGHWVETYDYRRKTELVTNFYKGNLSNDWLSNAGVQWVVAGPFEGNYDLTGLKQVYAEEGVRIYSLEK